MKLQRAFFVVIALVFLVSFTAAVSDVDNTRQTAQVGGAGGDPVPTTMSVISYTWVNADTNQDIGPLVNGSTVDIATFGTANFTLRADTTAGDLLPLSVRFGVNGTANFLTNNYWPYTINQSGANDDYVPAPYTLDLPYNITATPYTQTRANGTAGTPLSISFTLIDSATSGGGYAPVVDVNDVFLTAPAAGATVSAGQTLPMTCNITTAPDNVVWKLKYSYFYGSPTVAGDFVVLDNQNYTTGTYTQNVTIPANVPAGQLTLMCVAYFKNLTAPVVYTDDYASHAVTVGTVPPPPPPPPQNATSINISSPTAAYVSESQPFTFSVVGTPGDAGIASVKFTAAPIDGPAPIAGTVNFGTDTSPSFSVQGMFQERGAYTLFARATLTNGQVLNVSKDIFVTDYPMMVNGANTQFKITSYTGCNPCTFVEDAPQTINYTTIIPTGANFIGADMYAWGGNTEYGGTGLQFLGTATAPNGTFTFTIPEPGASLGQAGVNTLIIPVAFFSNTVTKGIYSVRVTSNPNENMPSISSSNIVNASGTNLGTLTSGMQINVGSQGSGLGQAISIKANPGNVSPVSVKFNLTGPSGFTAYTLCEGNSPFALFGDVAGVYNTWPPTMMLGGYTLLVTPYNAANCTGNAGTADSKAFQLVNNDDVTAPVAPTAVNITYRDNDEVRLGWTASASTDETGYKVYRNPGSVTTLGNVTTFTDTTGVTPTGSYAYTVTALDTVGNESGVSVAANAPTLSTTFAPGSTVTVKAGQTASVKNTPDGAPLGNQVAGKSGTIVGTSAWFGANYWYVDFTTSPTTPDGWVLESVIETTVQSGGSAVPTFYETKRGLTAKQLAVVCNTWYAQSCALADYYLTQRGIPTQNKVTLNFNPTGPTQFGYTYDTQGAVIGQDIMENYNGSGQNMRDYVLAQIQTAYTTAGMGTADIQAAALLWKLPYIIAELDTTEACLSTGSNCGSFVSAFSRGVFNNIDVANSGSTVSSYFESSTLTPKTTHNILPSFLVPFDAGNYAQGQQFINQGVNADNTYPIAEVYMLSTGDIDRSRARYSNMTTVEALFNQTDLGTTHAVDAQFSPTGSGQMGGCIDNPGDNGTDYISNKTDVLGYHTGRLCVPQLASNTPRLGAVGDHLTSHGGNLTGAAGAGQQPITDWLLDGYAASLGTIKEPWNGYNEIGEKFSKASTLWGNYYTGQTLVESYLKSVKTPGNTTFIGEPLSSPWKTSQVTFSGNTLTIKTTHIAPGQTWNLEESTDGSTWTTVQSNITAPNGKYGMKTITLPNAVTTKCYRLVNSAVTTTVKIPVTLGSTWTKTNGITNPETCVGAGGAPVDTAAPTAPTNVAVSGTPTTSSITLSWSASTGNPVGETVLYRIYRSATSTGTYAEVGTSSTATFTNSGLTANTTYYYKVASYDGVGNESAKSPSAGLAATTADVPAQPAAPTAPTGLSGSASSSSQVNLSWTDTSNNETTFTLERATNSGFTAGLVVVSSTIPADTTSYSATGLTATTTYYFRVKAVNATGSSAWAASSAIATPAAGGTGQVMGINGGVGPNNNEDITPGTNPFAASPNFAKDYYISTSTGNDSNNGLTPATAWKTITKLNTVSHVPGNRVFFKRGDIFAGKITSLASGTSTMPIQYRAYGTGAAPVITGSVLATNWTVHSGNIWKSTVGTGLAPKFLISNGGIQHLARTPNSGWLLSDSVAANNSTGTVTDSGLPAGSYVGAELNIRTSPWSWHAGMDITANTASVLTYNNASGGGPYVPFGPSYNTGSAGVWGWEDTGWAYMIQNKLSLLDSPGEWFYDSATGVLYFQAPGNVNPNTLTVELSKEDKAFALMGQTDISIKNLVFQNYTYAAIYWENAKRIAVENNELRYSTKALHNYNTNSAGTSQANIFNNNHVHDIFTDGIWTVSSSRDIFEGNVIEDIGMEPEYGANLEGWNLFGFRPSGDYIIRRNHISNIGYIGIAAAGNGLIEQNYLTNAMGTLGDGAAIAFDNSNGLRIKENIVEEIYTELLTMPVLYNGYIPLAKGIYFGDHDIVNTEIDKNVVIDVQADGVWMDHGLSYTGNKVTNNTIYGFSRSGLGVGDYSVYQDFPTCDPISNSPCFQANWNDVVTGNKVYGLDANQNNVYQMYAWGNGTTDAHTNFGTWNNNYYYNPYRTTKVQAYFRAWGHTDNYTMAQWQAFTPAASHDVNSTASNYTLTDPNLAADIYYNATPTATTVNVGTGGCTATGGPMAANQTIQPFSAVVVEHRVGGC